MVKFIVNGAEHDVAADDDTPLLWALRDILALPGTKFGCGAGLCGACTVHVDGRAVRSCQTQIGNIAGRSVTTIEALGATRVGVAVQDAWIAEDVVQCGYCQPGQMMTAAALLTTTPKPSDQEITAAMNGNLCRCGTYPRIRAAIHRAAGAASA
jgi:isoquinoline 1-oxidoreductase alpha subunit